MTDKRWNDDIAYVFSVHRAFLEIYGMWPLQKQTVFTRIQWGFCMIAQIILPMLAAMDLFCHNQDTNSNIESITVLVSTTVVLIKCSCITVCHKKLAMNINGAIDDWLSAKNNKETKKIMKKYAVKARILTFTLLYLLCIVIFLYIAVVVVINVKQTFFMDDLVDVNTTNWVFLLPSGPLNNWSFTGSQFAIILIIQIIQALILSFILCISDCFFFNITMHLSGQLEILKNQFKSFANKPDTEVNYRKKFVSLINRHNELTKLYENLEDSFHFVILFQMVQTTVMLALIGLRFNIYVNEKNYVEETKSILVLTYLFLQSLLFAYSGEYLQKGSEDIFYVLYTTPWFTFPLKLMKDLHFVMMRSSIPFRLTGGKFFYVNRETMMYVLKTSASYISVLRIALRK